MTEQEKKEIIELVHKTLRGFFGPFPEGELGARPLTQTEKTLLEVNNVLCEKIKEMPTIERQHGEWKSFIDGMGIRLHRCSECGRVPFEKSFFCPNCGFPMNEEALEILRKREGDMK